VVINASRKEGRVETLLTARQLQQRLQVDRITIYRLIANGRLKGVKVGGQWRFREEDVKELVAGGPAPSDKQASLKPALPLSSLEAVQRLFSTAAGVAVLLVDAHGEPLTGIANPSSFCTLLQTSEACRSRCIASWWAMTHKPARAPRLHRCHAGLLGAPRRVASLVRTSALSASCKESLRS
jgi:excisionase family DNA binding protein